MISFLFCQQDSNVLDQPVPAENTDSTDHQESETP